MRIQERQVVVFDLEWTSWPGFFESGFRQEGRHCDVVQIGAVKLDAANGFGEIAAFNEIVRPARHPDLSPYFVGLTGITQDRVDREGRPFPEALQRFIRFVSEGDAAAYCFGHDNHVLMENAAYHEMPPQSVLEDMRNLKAVFSEILDVPENQLVSSRMPSLIGLPNHESAHDALGDARCLASVLRHWRGRNVI